MEKPKASIAERLAELERRATAAEDAMKLLQKRVSILEGSSPPVEAITIKTKETIAARLAELERRANVTEDAVRILQTRVSFLEGQTSKQHGKTAAVVKKKQDKIDYEDPPLRDYLIFAPKKTNNTLFIEWFQQFDKNVLNKPKVALEQSLKNAGFIIVSDKSNASEIAVVVTAHVRDRLDGTTEVDLFKYFEKHLNAFLIIWQYRVYGEKFLTKIPIFVKSKMNVPTFVFHADNNSANPLGFIGNIPSPRTSNIASGICSTCLSSATGSNRCNVCQETFCGMECFAYGHKDCYQ